MKKFFVYGTLKEGGRLSGPVVRFREGDIKKATIVGTMFSVHGSYPAVVLEGNNIIHGELHEYDEQAVPIMDQIEGYGGPDCPHNLYNRGEVEVTLEDGTKDVATVYTFARPTNDLKVIGEGVWKI